MQKLDLMSVFSKRLLHKRGGGRDRLSPKAYLPRLEKEKDWIRSRCIDGSYRFSPYNEMLFLKGRNKLPRMISVPIVRDRLVLSAMCDYLTFRYDIHKRLANSYIRDISEFSKGNGQLYYFKTDISSFYDSIRHQALLEILERRDDPVSRALIKGALATPTSPPGRFRHEPNKRGVPQGLPISPVLAEIYMGDFDGVMEGYAEKARGRYFRYVDDILILTPVEVDWAGDITEAFHTLCLGLKLADEKTRSGKLFSDPVEYLGYSLSGYGVGIKLSNRRKFSNRVVELCMKYISQLRHSHLRPRYLASDDDFIRFAAMDLNLIISGFRIGTHNYGWLPYFQQISDLRILYELDDTLEKKCRGTRLEGRLNSFVKSYHALQRSGGKPYLYDFNRADTPAEKSAILIKMGRVPPDHNLTDEAIDYKYGEFLEHLSRNALRDLRNLS